MWPRVNGYLQPAVLDPSHYESDAFADDIFMLPGVPPWIMATLLAVRSMLHATLIQENI